MRAHPVHLYIDLRQRFGAKICSRRIGKFVRCKVLGSVAQLKERSLVTPEIHGSHPAIAFFYVKY